MKVKWYQLKGPHNFIECLREHVLKHQYKRGMAYGYVPLEIKRNYVGAQFVEEVTIAFDTFDPIHGMSTREDRAQNVSRFMISASSLPVEIIPGQYGISQLLRDLYSAFDVPVIISNINIDLLALLATMRKSSLSPGLKEIRVSSVALSPTAQASFTIRGTDILEPMRRLMGSRTGRITAFRLEELDGIKCACTINALGGCNVDGEDAESVLNIIRNMVAEQVKEGVSVNR